MAFYCKITTCKYPFPNLNLVKNDLFMVKIGAHCKKTYQTTRSSRHFYNFKQTKTIGNIEARGSSIDTSLP